MPKQPNTTSKGTPFEPSIVRAVWNSGIPVRGYDATQWRRDRFGHIIRYADYGNDQSPFGWHVDHIIPSERDGYDGLSNLEPLYWKSNIIKSDKYPFDPRILSQAFAY